MKDVFEFWAPECWVSFSQNLTTVSGNNPGRTGARMQLMLTAYSDVSIVKLIIKEFHAMFVIGMFITGGYGATQNTRHHC